MCDALKRLACLILAHHPRVKRDFGRFMVSFCACGCYHVRVK
jgi:hypothetical protein